MGFESIRKIFEKLKYSQKPNLSNQKPKKTKNR